MSQLLKTRSPDFTYFTATNHLRTLYVETSSRLILTIYFERENSEAAMDPGMSEEVRRRPVPHSGSTFVGVGI